MNSATIDSLPESARSDDFRLRTFQGKRAAVLLFAHYPSDPRPRRAAESLAGLGMQVDVLCLKQDEHEPSRETFNGVKVYRLPMKRSRGGKLTYIWQYARFILACFIFLTIRSITRPYQLVHVHNMPDVLVFAALVPRLLGAKVILDLHDPMPELMMTIFGLEQKSLAVRALKKLEKWSIRQAHAVLTVNLACRKIFSARSCPAEKIRVVMNSPDEGIFKYRQIGVPRTNDSRKPFVIMYHGSLVERHGLDVAIDALRQVRRSCSNVELRVYGQSTPFLEQVMGSIRGSDLESKVRYLGGKKLEEIVKAIGECDLGIIPNRRSIFTELNTPTRIFEYLSQGKPVIVPRAPGIEDYFGPEDSIYFELGDSKDLAEKIEYVFSHPEEVAAIIRRGQEVYLEHKWSSERERFVGVVEQLLSPQQDRASAAKQVKYPTLVIAHDRRPGTAD